MARSARVPAPPGPSNSVPPRIRMSCTEPPGGARSAGRKGQVTVAGQAANSIAARIPAAPSLFFGPGLGLLLLLGLRLRAWRFIHQVELAVAIGLLGQPQIGLR